MEGRLERRIGVARPAKRRDRFQSAAKLLGSLDAQTSES